MVACIVIYLVGVVVVSIFVERTGNADYMELASFFWPVILAVGLVVSAVAGGRRGGSASCSSRPAPGRFRVGDLPPRTGTTTEV